MAPRRRCPVCSSKQWHKEPSSGLIACSEGHVLQNYRNEASEAGEIGPHAMHKRTLKSGRKKKGKQSRADPKLYHGSRGRYHYFQCLQLLLRHQIASLVRLWDLPPEFEIICRDIWALHLSLLSVPPSPEPYYYMQETKDDQAPKAPDQDSEPGGDQEDRENKSDTGDDSDLLPSSCSAEDTGADAPPKAQRKLRGKRGDFAWEMPESCIAVLVLGFWTMRIPIFLKDIVRIIESYELPYLDPVRFLPAEMTLHLTKHTKESLSPFHAPSVMSLHRHSSRLAKRMYASYGIFTPEANAAPILWRSVRELGGTPMLYMLTKRLGQALSLPLTLHHTLAPSLEQRKKGDPRSHKYDNVPPEVALTATAIIVLKMVYGLDGDKRVPTEEGDPACAMPRIKEWLKLVKEMEETEWGETMFSSRSDMCVGELDDGKMDEYLRLCERGLLGENKTGDVLERYFPLVEKVKQEDGEGRPCIGRTLEATMRGEDGVRPGEGYKIGEVGEEYEVVLRGGSYVVGIKVENICKIIEKYERRII